MNKSKIKELLSYMHCSICGCDFDENSINIKMKEENTYIIELACSNCGKNFGIAILSDNKKANEADNPFIFQDCPVPISYDDILDAHKFIDNLQTDWNKYVPDNLKKLKIKFPNHH